MKSEKIKLTDIAKALGISTISVSRALSGQEGVSDELRDKVLLKANEMGYLRTKSLEQNKVLVLHQKPFIQDNSNYSHIMQGMEKALQAAGCEYDMEFTDKNNQVKLSFPNKLQKGLHYDGIIFVGGFDNSYVDFITKKISNYVCYTGYSPSKDCDGIWYNFNNSGYKQCEYLIKKGHKRIGYLSNNNGYVSKEKVLGIISAMEDHGLTVQNEFFVYSEDDYEERIIKLIKKTSGPTAFICQWDYTAMKLIKNLHDHGIKVPEDISIIGHGNTEMSALCIPALTTMEIYIDYACESTVALLLKRLGRPDKPSENILIHSTLIERDSVRTLS
jgi:DNA-binding LacI/PurR family transcriptional regulator